MEKSRAVKIGSNRRKFLRNGMLAAGAATMGASLLTGGLSAFGRERDDDSPVTKGDIAILRFLNALEQIEADLWIQYSELGGVQDNEVSGVNGGNPLYVGALQILDGDMAQYIHDNADDEISHAAFLKAYLESKGAEAVDLSPFAKLPSSKAPGANQKLKRLTNLTQLTVDTSFWSRYRSVTNPDFDLGAPFVQAVPSLNVGQHTAIPRSEADTAGSTLSNNNPATITPHLQAIAFTAGFHFAFIEEGGTSLYPALAQKVTNLEVLRVLLSIGPSETMHFQTWHDKAGNAALITDGNLTFPNLNSGVDPNNGNTGNSVADMFQTNLIMPEPTLFLNPNLGPVSIVRPTSIQQGGAVASVVSFVDDGLFLDPATNKNTGIVDVLMDLAEEADEARRTF